MVKAFSVLKLLLAISMLMSVFAMSVPGEIRGGRQLKQGNVDYDCDTCKYMSKENDKEEGWYLCKECFGLEEAPLQEIKKTPAPKSQYAQYGAARAAYRPPPKHNWICDTCYTYKVQGQYKCFRCNSYNE